MDVRRESWPQPMDVPPFSRPFPPPPEWSVPPEDADHALRRATEPLRRMLAGRIRPPVSALSVPLCELEAALRRHREQTERADGLFAQIVEAEPTLEARVDRLRRRHERLLEEVVQVRRAVRRETGGAAVLPALERLVQHLRRHDREESRLLLDCWSLDLGAGE